MKSLTIVKALKLPLIVPEDYITAFLKTMEIGSMIYNFQANYEGNLVDSEAFIPTRAFQSNRKQEKFVCIVCGYTTHADFNASCTILEQGSNITGCS